MQQVFFDPRQFVAGQQVQRDTMARNALADLAPAAIQGNENALAQLAQYAPEVAMQIQDRSDQRRVRQERLDLDRQRVGIAQQRLTADQEAQLREIATAQTSEQQKATQTALTAMQNGYAQGNRSIFETGLAALRRIDPDTPNNVTFDNFAEMAPALDGMVEIYATLEAPKLSAAEAEIARLMETGLDRETAIKIKDGVWVVSRDPQTGEAQVIDKATSLPVAAQQAQLAPQPDAAPGTVPELSFGDRYTASPRAFGVGGAVRSAANAVGDTIGLGQPFPDVADTQSDFGVLRETLVNDLASGYPRQPPSWLLQQIQDLTPRAGSPLQGPEGAKDKLAALGRSVVQELESIQGQLRNRRLRPTLKQELEGQAASLQKVLDRVTEAHGSFQTQGLAISPDVQERMRAYE